MEERLNSIIYRKLCNDLRDYEFFSHGNSVLILDRESKTWLAQKTKSFEIYYNDRLVNPLLKIFDINIFQRYEILKPWFKSLFNTPNYIQINRFSTGYLPDKTIDSALNKRKRVGVKVSDRCSNFNQNKDMSNNEILENLLKEDLGVWFGTKKKPKGSNQPKGPWVNICRKDKDGKHPPCGRPEAKDKGYPKCRAAGVAGKMSDSEKKSACQQKRTAEKSNPKSGTGNKPKMVSHKQKNESISQLIRNSLNEMLHRVQ
jgi:hypothetical protein